jgi:hypothetical protein
MTNILHDVSHWFGWNRTRHITAFNALGYFWEGVECEACGAVSDRRISPHCTLSYTEAFFCARFGEEVKVTNEPRRGLRVRLMRDDLMAQTFVDSETMYHAGALDLIAEKLEKALGGDHAQTYAS